MASEPISAEMVLFFILYGVTGAVAFFAALYLLLRRGNAFAPDVTPPLHLRRWAASFFAVSVLGHVWWYLFYIHSADIFSADDLLHSTGYVMTVVLDCVTLLTTIAGTLLAMLQDRRRPVWPVFVAMLPFVVMGGAILVWPSKLLMQIAIAYILLLYALITVYVAFAVRQYGRWLRDNYADLERKEVWLSHVLLLVFLLAVIFYTLIENSVALFFLFHFVELSLFIFLLWRVETLPQLTENSGDEQSLTSNNESTHHPSTPREVGYTAISGYVDMKKMEQMLADHCVDTHLYLQRDLTLQQLAQALGTNRSYLSQYFSRQSLTYNTYINNLRINYFVRRYQAVAASGTPFTVQQLASESGYRSYSTFSLAFKQRMGQSVTAWMRGDEAV